MAGETDNQGEKIFVLDSYAVTADNVTVETNIIEKKTEFVRQYFLNLPSYGPGTRALLENLRNSLISESTIETEKLLDAKLIGKLKEKFSARANEMLKREMPKLSDENRTVLVGILMHEMLGLGKIEFLLADPNLEEIVINQSNAPVWVYQKRFGWLKTNIVIDTEEEVENYASIIARRVGKQITSLTPLLDAHLVTGDRANATLYPISSKGNTLTIRMFRRDPWTVTDFLRAKTATTDLMALIWLAIQYELNIILSGGTASGKTSFLNICLPFMQPNQRILTIEDTRELELPEFLHWVPLTTREPNAEGKGGVSMLDLLINSLRMRPDRIIVGEVRRQREAEVMFEAMHTGHSVYTTLHAETADETIRRLTNPPINIPKEMLSAVHLNVVMFRNRRIGIRRVLQIAEFVPERQGVKEGGFRANSLYRWRGSDDSIVKQNEALLLYDELSLHTGLVEREIKENISEKERILKWMMSQKIHNINDVGKVMASYYMDQETILELVRKNKPMVG